MAHRDCLLFCAIEILSLTYLRTYLLTKTVNGTTKFMYTKKTRHDNRLKSTVDIIVSRDAFYSCVHF